MTVFREGDRVRHHDRVGTVQLVTSDNHPYRVRFDNGSTGKFTPDELDPYDLAAPEYGELRSHD